MHLRRITKDDATLLFDWRNDPDTYLFYRNPNPITWAEHAAWFNKKLSQLNGVILIAEDSEGPIGYVRSDPINNSESELSWAIAPERRGQGLEKKMLQLAIDHTDISTYHLIAEIKKQNSASLKMAESLGFTHADAQEEFYFLKRLKR